VCGRRQDRLQPDAHHSFQCIAAGASGAPRASLSSPISANVHFGAMPLSRPDYNY
jgi:hypothetical protein